MKSLFLGLVLSLCLLTQGYCVDEWAKGDPAGTRNASDIDAYVLANNEALDRYLAYGRHGCKVTYASASTITVGAGSIVCSNSAGTIRRLRANSTATTVSWSDIDTGSEAASSTYYLWAIGDADAATFTVKISLSSTAPGSSTYYKRLGSFYNDSSSNIIQVVDDGHPTTRFGDWVAKSNDTAYQASTDGIVIGWSQYASGGHAGFTGYSDSSNPPTTQRVYGLADASGGTDTSGVSISMPVKRGDYWKIVAATGSTATIYWVPLQLE